MLARFLRNRNRVTLKASASTSTKRTSVKKTFIVSPRPDLIYLPGTINKIDDAQIDLPFINPTPTQMEMNLLEEAEFFAKEYPNTIQFLQVGGFYELFDLSVHDLEDLSRYHCFYSYGP
jgi:hypothetical protein